MKPLLTKLVRSRWLDIDLFLGVFMDQDEINTQKLGQYPAILTSRLVNNPYVFETTTQYDTEPKIDFK